MFGICCWCARLVIDRDDPAYAMFDEEMPQDSRMYQVPRMRKLLEVVSKRKRDGQKCVLCPHCHLPQPAYQATYPTKWLHIQWSFSALAVSYVMRDGREAHARMDEADRRERHSRGTMRDSDDDDDEEDDDDDDDEEEAGSSKGKTMRHRGAVKRPHKRKRTKATTAQKKTRKRQRKRKKKKSRVADDSGSNSDSEFDLESEATSESEASASGSESDGESARRRDDLRDYHKMTAFQKAKARQRAGAPLNDEQRAWVLREMQSPFNTVRCRAILECFARDWPEDLEWLGVYDKHPEQWVPQAIPVLPNIFRPTVSIGGARKGRNNGNHDLTVIYNKIRLKVVSAWKWCIQRRCRSIPESEALQAAERLAGSLKKPVYDVPAASADHLPMGADDLQAFIASGSEQRQAYEDMSHWFNIVTCNHKVHPETKQVTGRMYESIRLILEGKRGMVRDQMMGKRVNHSGRFPIIGDDSIMPTEVGMPHAFLRQATVRVRVFDLNLEKLRACVLRGCGVLRGAAQVEPADGALLELDQMDPTTRTELAKRLRPGWFVHRYVETGDPAIMNRPPTLWKQGIMSHLIHGTDNPEAGTTARIPLTVTPGYNADFDGDEMMVHVPQTIEGRAEALTIMSVNNNVLSQQTGLPAIGLVQDDLIAVFGFTRKDAFFDRADAAQLLTQRSTSGAIFKRSGTQLQAGQARLGEAAILIPNKDRPGTAARYWTGKQLLSAAGTRSTRLHLDAYNVAGTKRNVETQEDRWDALFDDCRVVMRDGELLSGQVDKRIAGKSGILIAALAKFAPDEGAATKFMARAGFTMREFTSTQGFSVTPDDFALTAQARTEITRDQDVAVEEAERLEALAQKLDIDYDTFEASVHRLTQALQELTISRTIEDTDRLAWKEGRRHNVLEMVRAGAKGSTSDITHIAGALGQMNASGGRINNKRMPGPDETASSGLRNSKARTLSCFRRGDAGLGAHGFARKGYMHGLTFHQMIFNAMFSIEGIVNATTATAMTGYTQRKMVAAIGTAVANFGFTVDGKRIIEWRSGGDTFAPG